MNLKIINIFLFITFYLVGSTSARKHRKHKVDDLAFLEPNILDDNYNSKEYLKRKIRNRKLSNSIYREIKNIIEDDRKNSDENSEINNYKKKDSNEKIGSEKINSVRYKEKEPLENLTEEFAVEINGNADVASEVAKKHGFTILRHIKALGSVYKFRRNDDTGVNRHERSKRSARQLLLSDPKVVRVDRQMRLVRLKRAHGPFFNMDSYKGIMKETEELYGEADEGSDDLSKRNDDADEDEDGKRMHGGVGKYDRKSENKKDKNVSEIFFNDPMFEKQWYLLNLGQTGGIRGYDLNVVPAWKLGYTGRGVVVSIIDDGIDHTHPDLIHNYDAKASADLSDSSDLAGDPMPNLKDPHTNHGTMCAGEVAAQANNSNCCVGVAFNANIGGIRLLDARITDLLEAQALLHNNQHIHIYSSSWGPADNGRTMEAPRRYCKQALKEGVTRGRDGRGSIFVWATGNGGAFGDSCNCDGYVSSPYTLAIGSISDHGLSTFFSEVCSSTMAVVFTGGSHLPPVRTGAPVSPRINVVTTDVRGACTTSFLGTSSAAPLASGCVALALEANPSLTWRDVQHIVAETSIIPSEEEAGWVMNGGGYHVHERMGFGVLDCAGMVRAALNWSLVQESVKCIVKYTGPPRLLKAGGSFEVSFNVSEACSSLQSIDSIEHLQLRVTMEHRRRGDVSLHVVSASGTRSEMLKRRPQDASEEGIRFTFMSVRHWGEEAKGLWKVVVKDHTADGAGKSVGATDDQLHERELHGDGGDGGYGRYGDDNSHGGSVGVGKLLKLSLMFRGVEGSFENHGRWEGLDGKVTRDGRGGGTKMEKKKRNLQDEPDPEYDVIMRRLLRRINRINRQKWHTSHSHH